MKTLGDIGVICVQALMAVAIAWVVWDWALTYGIDWSRLCR